MALQVNSTTGGEDRRVRLVSEAMRLIQSDLSAELSVERLADELGVSWSTLAHLFPGVGILATAPIEVCVRKVAGRPTEGHV